MMAVTVERALELPFRLLCVPWSQKVKRSRERETQDSRSERGPHTGNTEIVWPFKKVRKIKLGRIINSVMG